MDLLFMEGPAALAKVLLRRLTSCSIRRVVPSFSHTPPSTRKLITFLIPVYTVPPAMLLACLESLRNQTESNWEAVLVDDATPDPRVPALLAGIRDPRISVFRRPVNGNICVATNEALSHSRGEYCCFLDCDDVLEPWAVEAINEALSRRPEVDFWYSDEILVYQDGRRAKAAFYKPEWSPETALSLMYTGHLAAVRTKLLEKLNGLRLGTEGAQDHDLVLRSWEAGAIFGHIPAVLYRWRSRKGSTASHTLQKTWAYEAGIRVRSEALNRRGGGTLRLVRECFQAVPVYAIPADVEVTLIIPTKDHPDILGRALDSFQAVDAGCPFKVIVIDNGSSEQNLGRNQEMTMACGGLFLQDNSPFNFAALNNRGAREAEAGVLVFCNDDLEARESGWLATLAGQALQPGIGAVGPKLLYPGSNRIQHAGIVLLPQGPAHLLHQKKDEKGYQFGWTRLVWNVSAITGACLAVTAERLAAVGGWNEAFPVAYNDVDLCLRLREAGFRNVVRNDVSLCHHESASRGLDAGSPALKARQAQDLDRLRSRHPAACGPDPYYSQVFDQHRSDFSLAPRPGKVRKGPPPKGWVSRPLDPSGLDIRSVGPGEWEVHMTMPCPVVSPRYRWVSRDGEFWVPLVSRTRLSGTGYSARFSFSGTTPPLGGLVHR